MGLLGQVEGGQMESRQETPAALTVNEKEKGLGEGEESDRRKSILHFSLGEKARCYVKKSSRGKKREEFEQ